MGSPEGPFEEDQNPYQSLGAGIFLERLIAQAGQEKDVYAKALETAAEELVPEYVQRVSAGATEDQRQQIITLAESERA